MQLFKTICDIIFRLIGKKDNKLCINEDINKLSDKINRLELIRLDIFENKRIIKSQQKIIEELDLILFDVCKRLDKYENANSNKKRFKKILIRVQPSRKCKNTINN